MEEKIQVLFVCTGNICRSPTAEVVFRDLLRKRGLESRIEAKSCGTQAYHVGEGADPRSTRHAAQRGYDLTKHVASRFRRGDLEEFDWILCMDRSHLEFVKDAGHEGQKARVELFLKYAQRGPALDMPDPYYGGDRGFEEVIDLCEMASQGLLDAILASDLEESSRRG